MQKAWPDEENGKMAGRPWIPWAVGFILLSILAVLGALFYLLAPPNWHVPPAGAEAIDTPAPHCASMQRPLERPYLGITYQDLTNLGEDRADIAAGGVMVTSIGPGSPAAMAGVAIGDAIMAVEGQPLGRENSLIKLLLDRRAGDRVKLLVQRGRDHVNIEVVLGKR